MDRRYCIINKSDIDSTFLSKILGTEGDCAKDANDIMRIYEVQDQNDPYFLSHRLVDHSRAMKIMDSDAWKEVQIQAGMFSKIKNFLLG